MKVVTYLGSLVQSCCGEGGSLETNITGVCGEYSQCFSCTGFVPSLSMCVFMAYTSQALGCCAGNYLRWALGCVHLWSLSRSGSDSQVLSKGADSVGPSFCALPRSEHLRWLDTWWVQSPPPRWAVHLIASPIPAAQFSGCTTGHTFSGVPCVSSGELISGWNPPSWCQPPIIRRTLG